MNQEAALVTTAMNPAVAIGHARAVRRVLDVMLVDRRQIRKVPRASDDVASDFSTRLNVLQTWRTEMKAMKAVAAMTMFAALSAPAWSSEFASKDEAKAMVAKAVAFVKENGPEKAYAEFTGKSAGFIDRDLYVVVYGMDGKVLAHGANAKLVGKDMMEATDVDGKYYVKERMELAAKKADFWQDYKFVNPVTKKIEPKQMFCHPLPDSAVCAGIYVK